MFRLRADVGNGVARLGNAYGESAVALLPREAPRMCFVHPVGGSPLDQLHGLGQGKRRRQRQKSMYVILCAANNERLESVLACYAAEKSPQLRLDVRRYQVATLFRR